MEELDRIYPAWAFTETHELWWEIPTWPGTKRPLGDEPRIAAWLAANKSIGDTFTTSELRDALGHRLSQTSRNDREHFQRRVRQLRSIRDGWVFPSVKHDRNLDVGDYRLDRIGWHPSLGKRPKDLTAVSSKNRLAVIERDHYRCFHCGITEGEPYPERPELTAVMTAGHILPAEAGGSGEPGNLRAECSLCNEAARSDTKLPESYDRLLASVNNLNSSSRRQLAEWIEAGQRTRTKVDEAYDRYRLLTPDNKVRLRDHLKLTNSTI